MYLCAHNTMCWYIEAMQYKSLCIYIQVFCIVISFATRYIVGESNELLASNSYLNKNTYHSGDNTTPHNEREWDPPPLNNSRVK